jgi:protein SCO1
MNGRHAVRRGLAAAMTMMLAAAGCAGQGVKLQGHVPPAPMLVGSITMPEVRPGEPDRPFAFRAAPGGLLYVYFGFTNCPDICPTTLSDLRRALRTLGPAAERVDVAFVTVDPYRDSAAVLVPYLASFTSRGHALVPRTQEQLGRAESAFKATSTVSKQADGTYEVSHTGLGYVVDDAGHVRVQWDFGTKPAVMAHDLRLLLAGPPA